MLGLMHELVAVVILALAVSTVSMTMTKAKISKPIRDYLKPRSTWFGGLFSCPYCFGHWVSFAAVAVARPVLTDSGLYLADLLFTALAVTALAAMSCGLIYRSLAVMTD